MIDVTLTDPRMITRKDSVRNHKRRIHILNKEISSRKLFGIPATEHIIDQLKSETVDMINKVDGRVNRLVTETNETIEMIRSNLEDLGEITDITISDDTAKVESPVLPPQVYKRYLNALGQIFRLLRRQIKKQVYDDSEDIFTQTMKQYNRYVRDLDKVLIKNDSALCGYVLGDNNQRAKPFIGSLKECEYTNENNLAIIKLGFTVLEKVSNPNRNVLIQSAEQLNAFFDEFKQVFSKDASNTTDLSKSLNKSMVVAGRIEFLVSIVFPAVIDAFDAIYGTSYQIYKAATDYTPPGDEEVSEDDTSDESDEEMMSEDTEESSEEEEDNPDLETEETDIENTEETGL